MAVDNGLVVGNAQYTPPNSTTLTRAFAWTATGGMVALGTLGGEQSIVYAVSNGQAVGWANTADGRQHAFKWTAAGGMVDLGTFCFQHRHAEQWNREEADSSQNRYRAGFCDRHHHVLIEFETRPVLQLLDQLQAGESRNQERNIQSLRRHQQPTYGRVARGGYAIERNRSLPRGLFSLPATSIG